MRTATLRRPVQAILAVAVLLSCFTLAGGTAHAGPDTSPIAPPANTYQFASVHAVGQQIYRCQVNASGRWEWTFVEPSASLNLGSDELVFGSHMAGPTWRHQDGSAVVGEKVAFMPSPSGSIPWLLLRATSSTSGPRSGTVLWGTAYIQRTNTTGGLAPSARCDSTGAGRMWGVDYTATYNFYREYYPY